METKNKLVLVTGGAGFIGSHLVEELVKRGYQVRVLDNLMRSTKANIQHLIDEEKIEFIDGDIRYETAVDRAMKDVDYVFHQAAVCINRSQAYPKECFDINLNGSYVVFNSALKHNVKKVIFASSASVYGDPEVLPMLEENPLNPVTPYCVAKLSGEFLLKYLAKRHNLKYFILRYFNVYGLRQKVDAYYTSVMILFIKRLINNQAPIILGEGNQLLDFVNVKDIVQANILAMESDIYNEIVNVGTGKSTSVKELANILTNSLNLDIKPIFKGREILVKERRADITKIKRLLNFIPKIDTTEGLKEVAQDIAKCPEKY